MLAMDPPKEVYVYNPLDKKKDIGRRTGLPIYKKRNLKSTADQFDNYLSESEGEQSINVTKTAPLLSRENLESPQVSENTFEKSHVHQEERLDRHRLSQVESETENLAKNETGAADVGAVNPFAWNSRFGRRTGKDLLAGRSKIISNGMENYSDFLSDSSVDTSCTLNPTPVGPIPRSVHESTTSNSAKESEDSSPSSVPLSLRKKKGKTESREVGSIEVFSEDPIPKVKDARIEEKDTKLEITEGSRSYIQVLKEPSGTNDSFKHSFAKHKRNHSLLVENNGIQSLEVMAEKVNVVTTEKENTQQYVVSEKGRQRTDYLENSHIMKRKTDIVSEAKQISQTESELSDVGSEREYVICGEGLDKDTEELSDEELNRDRKKYPNELCGKEKAFPENAVSVSQSHIESQIVKEISIPLNGNKNLKEKEATTMASKLSVQDKNNVHKSSSSVLARGSAKSCKGQSKRIAEKTATNERKSSDDEASSGIDEPGYSKLTHGTEGPPDCSASSHTTRTKSAATTLDFGGDGTGSVSKAEGHQNDFFGIKKRLSYSVVVVENDKKKSDRKKKGKNEGKSKGNKSLHSFLESHDTMSENYYNTSSVSSTLISLAPRRISQLTSQRSSTKSNLDNLNTSSASSSDFNIVEEEVIVARKSPVSERKAKTAKKRSSASKDKREQGSRNHTETKEMNAAALDDLEATGISEASPCKQPKRLKNIKNNDKATKKKSAEQGVKEVDESSENLEENEDSLHDFKNQSIKRSQKTSNVKKNADSERTKNEDFENDKEFNDSEKVTDKKGMSNMPEAMKKGRSKAESASRGVKEVDERTAILEGNEDSLRGFKNQSIKRSQKTSKMKKNADSGRTKNEDFENDKEFNDSEKVTDKKGMSNMPEAIKKGKSKAESASRGKNSKGRSKIPMKKKNVKTKPTTPIKDTEDCKSQESESNSINQETEMAVESITSRTREARKRKVTEPVQYPHILSETKASRKQSKQERVGSKKSKSKKMKEAIKEKITQQRKKAKISKTSPKQTRLSKKRAEKMEQDQEVENNPELDGPISPLNHPDVENTASPLVALSSSEVERSPDKLTAVSKTIESELERPVSDRKSLKKQKAGSKMTQNKSKISPDESGVVSGVNNSIVPFSHGEVGAEPEIDEIEQSMEYPVPLNSSSSRKKTVDKKSSRSGKRKSMKSTQSKPKENETLEFGEDFSPLRSFLPNITPQSGVSFRVPRHSVCHSLQKEDGGSKPETPSSKKPQAELNGTLLSSCLRDASAKVPQKRGRKVRISNIIDNHLLSPQAEIADTTTDVQALSLLSMSSSPVHYAETTTNNIGPEKSKTLKVTIPDLSYKIVPPEQNPVPGLRRSTRTRVKRLNSYKGEGIKYRRDSTGFGLLVEGIQPSLIEAKQKVKEEERRKKLRQRKMKAMALPARPPKKRLSTHWKLEQEVTTGSDIPVINPDNGEEVLVDLIARIDEATWVGPALDPVMNTDPVAICLQLQQGGFQTGELHMRPLAEKETQLVEETLVFKMLHGKVCLSINGVSTIVVGTGDDFVIPKGSSYSIKNLRRDIARIYFINLNNTEDVSSSGTGNSTSSS